MYAFGHACVEVLVVPFLVVSMPEVPPKPLPQSIGIIGMSGIGIGIGSIGSIGMPFWPSCDLELQTFGASHVPADVNPLST